MNTIPQVRPEHYATRKYNHRVRWMNYWHQIDDVLCTKPDSVLEVGKGIGLVSEHLSKVGVSVTTVDIDEKLSPDTVASVEKLPFQDNTFDLVLAAEILEHLPWERVPRALAEMCRVAKHSVIISLPFSGSYIHFSCKIPKLPQVRIFIPIPYFWKNHVRTHQHYWSVGTKDFPLTKIRKTIKSAGFKIVKESVYHDDFDHAFFTLKKV